MVLISTITISLKNLSVKLTNYICKSQACNSIHRSCVCVFLICVLLVSKSVENHLQLSYTKAVDMMSATIQDILKCYLSLETTNKRK